MITSILSMFRKPAALIAIFGAVVLAGMALNTNSAKALTNCTGAPTAPTFNPFTITYTDEDCKDYPAIDARLADGGQYSQNQQDWDNGLDARNGDEVYVLMYVHNGATDVGLPVDPHEMHNVKVATEVPTNTGTRHTLRTTFTANNAATYTKSFTINTAENEKLEVINGSGELYNYQNQKIGSGFNVGNTTYTIGDLRACFKYSLLIRFKVRVVREATPTPTPTPTKTPTPTPTQTTLPVLYDVSCPFTNASNRTIVRFGTTQSPMWISANGSQSSATTSSVSTYLASGTYRVSLASYDDHSISGSQYQPQEQWYAILRNANGNDVVQTNAIADLPDGQDYYWNQVNDNFVVNQTINSIVGYHAAYPNSNPNSIAPICTAFDLIPGASPSVTPSTAPSTPSISALPTCTNSNYSAMISWSGTQDQSFGFYVDIDTNSNFTSFYNKQVSSGFSTDTSNFRRGTETLTLQPDTTYYVRVYNGQHSGIASFRVPRCDNQTTSISVTKNVRNISQGSGEFDSVSARPGETVEFVIRVQNTGSNTLFNARVNDFLPSGLRYQSGSTTLDGSFRSDGIVSGGISLGDISSGRTVIVRFQAVAETDSYFGSGTTTLTNTVQSSSNNTGTVSDTAYVNINRDQVGTGKIEITKFGKNITRGEDNDQTRVIAYPDNTLRFVLRVRSTSNVTLYNVIVRDVLPANITYINRTTSLNNNIIADGIVSGGVNIGALSPYQEVIVRFDARTNSAGYFNQGYTYLTNNAYARADNVSEVNAHLPITLRKGTVLGTVGRIRTGVNTGVLTLLVSGLLSCLYLIYTRTNVFKFRLAHSMVKQSRSDGDKFNFV